MTLHDFIVMNAHGEAVDLSQYKDHVVLVVNTASKCGFTKQYKGLEDLYEKYRDKNFVILAFPCNQFGAQEPGTDEQIIDFCSTNFGVEFPIMHKIDVNGPDTIPFYQWIKSQTPEGEYAITWNFVKFLFDKEGRYVRRFNHDEPPAVCETFVQSLL
jgi:glutathione peroxidase